MSLEALGGYVYSTQTRNQWLFHARCYQVALGRVNVLIVVNKKLRMSITNAKCTLCGPLKRYILK